jgi:hypothetical protein
MSMIKTGTITIKNTGVQYGNTTTTTIPNYGTCQYLNSCGTSYASLYNNTVTDMAVMSEYIDYMNRILGIDMDFNRFRDMSDGEKQQFLRNEKLKRLI